MERFRLYLVGMGRRVVGFIMYVFVPLLAFNNSPRGAAFRADMLMY